MSVCNIYRYETLRYLLLFTVFIYLRILFFLTFPHTTNTQDSFHNYIYFFMKKTLMSTDVFCLCVCQWTVM